VVTAQEPTIALASDWAIAAAGSANASPATKSRFRGVIVSSS